MRVLFWFGALVLVGWLVRARWQRLRRRLRGEPEPPRQGPRTITLLVAAIVIVYALLIGYRLVVGQHALL